MQDIGTLLGMIWQAWWGLLLNILVVINSVVGNPGISIIIFTFFIRLLTVPLTMKSLRSSRNMQQIQPLIKEVQKKYGKDKAKQQEETMKIYQQYGVNPAAGCFPVLVQLPIFIGLYSALQFTLQGTGTEVQIAQHLAHLKTILYNPAWADYANFSQPFLWLSNLAKPDQFYIWPVLSGIFQFIQSRMAMPIRDPNQPLDPQTKMMNNMMQFMPIYIVFISLGFPAGTVIYWAMSNVFGAVQQYFITGFGSLPTLPGLGFLPRKVITPPPLPPPPAEGVPVKKGLMAQMMDKALQAQEAQKALQESPVPAQGGNGTAVKGADGASTMRVKGKGKGSENPVKAVPTSTMKYASDLKYRDADSANGLHDGEISEISAIQLPRKKRNKK